MLPTQNNFHSTKHLSSRSGKVLWLAILARSKPINSWEFEKSGTQLSLSLQQLLLPNRKPYLLFHLAFFLFHLLFIIFFLLTHFQYFTFDSLTLACLTILYNFNVQNVYRKINIFVSFIADIIERFYTIACCE